jgi:hypothetical protein
MVFSVVYNFRTFDLYDSNYLESIYLPIQSVVGLKELCAPLFKLP